MSKIRTTYNRQGAGTASFEYYTKERMEDGDIKLVGWGTYGPSSVLYGQASKNVLCWFKSEEQLEIALAEAGIYPADVHWSNKWTEPQISVNHLPDEPDW